MAKQFDNLFDGMTTFSHLHQSFKKAAKGKRKNPSVAAFEWNLEPNLLALQEDLQSGKWKHADYESFYIRDPKLRLISAAPFRDRVVHHALCSVLEPIFERTFIGSSYANRIFLWLRGSASQHPPAALPPTPKSLKKTSNLIYAKEKTQQNAKKPL